MTKRIRPSFRMKETGSNAIGDVRVGQNLEVIINARVVERTKNFAVLRVDYVFLRTSRRAY